MDDQSDQPISNVGSDINVSSSESGPRTIQLQKCENGYGFTLRYFVVYPPEDKLKTNDEDLQSNSDSKYSDTKRGSQSGDAMDTIFVKSVIAGSEADKAGLATGDRIVSVNGIPVNGKSYDEVLELIHNSDDLQLLVVPKEDDIIQLYFSSACDQASNSRDTDSRSCHPLKPSAHSTPSLATLANHHPTCSPLTTTTISSSCTLSPASRSGSISSSESHSLPLNYYSSTFNSSMPKVSYHPCPPLYQHQDAKYPDKTQCMSASFTNKFPTSEENLSGTNCNHYKSNSNLPTDIAYQHQALVNRRKEEFLSNSSGLNEPIVSQPWVRRPVKGQATTNREYYVPCTDEGEPIVPKNSSSCDSQSENDAISAWNSEIGLTQTWPSPSHIEPLYHGSTCSSTELAVVNSGMSGSQQSLHSDRTKSLSSQNLCPATRSLSMDKPFSPSNGDDKDSTYGRTFVTTLSKIQENLASNSISKINQLDKGAEYRISACQGIRKACSLDSDSSAQSQLSSQDTSSIDNQKHPQLQFVSHRTKQFERGGQVWEEEANRRNLYKNELARISSHCRTPRVVERTAKYENMSASSSQETISTIPETDGTTSPRSRTSAEIEAKFCHHLAKMGIMTPSVVEATGLSSPRNDPPSSSAITDTPLKSHKMVSRAQQLKKSRAMRQNSYLTAVNQDDKRVNGIVKSRPVTAFNAHPVLDYRNSEPLRRLKNSQSACHGFATTPPNGVKRSSSVAECSFAHDNMAAKLTPNRNSTNGFHLNKDYELFCSQFDNLLDDGAISNLIAAFDSMLSGVSSSPGARSSNTSSTASSTSSTSARNSSAGVVLRKKALYEAASVDGSDDRSGKSVRRVSYLKANEDHELANKRVGHVEVEDHKQSTPRSHIHSIQKLKSFFGERTPQIVEATEKAQQPPSPTKEAPPSFAQDVTREGPLHCKATLVDGKRASDRSWKPVWAVLRGHALYFYRDKKDANNFVGLLEDHAPINLKSCIVDIAHDYTKKKNVFRLTTFGVSEYLLQADDNSDMLKWIQTIQSNSDPDNDQQGIGNQNLILRKTSATTSDHQFPAKEQIQRLSPQSTQKGIMKLNFRNKSPTSISSVSGTNNTQSNVASHIPLKNSKKSNQPEEHSPKSKTWRGKMVKSLRKFHGSSASASIPQTEGMTIGILLEECPVTALNEYVPLLVELCTKIVEAKGLEIVGIYRIPGNNASVAALQEAVNKGFENLNLQDPRWNDVNVISSLLKAFFRQLPEPLFTSELYPLFIEANKLEDNTQRMLTLKKLVHELPEYHYETLHHLMFHLKNVVINSHINKMEARNLAIVFGPNLVRTADNNMVTMVTDMSHQCRIIETIVSNVDWIFSEDDKSLPNKESSDSLSEQSATNTNLLLDNIQRVEAKTAHHGDVSAKDIVSNMVSTACRKSRVKAVKKDFSERNIDQEIETRHNRYRRGSVPTDSLLSKHSSKSSISDWLRFDGVDSTNSTLSSSSRTLSSQTLSEDSVSHQSMDTKPSNDSLDQGIALADSSVSAKVSRDVENIVEKLLSGKETEQNAENKPPPYSTLSPSTQERIKRFETETKALLQRDLHTRRTRQETEKYKLELERQRIEIEWQRAKRDLEQEDFLDELADNPSDITKKISDFTYKISDLSSQSNKLKTVEKTSDYSSSSTSPAASQRSISTKSSSSIPRYEIQNATLNKNSALPPKPMESSRIRNGVSQKPQLSSSSFLRRGNSAENIIDMQANPKSNKQVKINLSVKHGGSLDSLRECYGPKETHASSPEDGDLLSSITATLDSRIQEILATRKENPLTSHQPTPTQPPIKELSSSGNRLNYRDPSLYRNRPVNKNPSVVNERSPLATSPQKSIFRDPSMHGQNRPNNRHGIVGNEHFLLQFDDGGAVSSLAFKGDKKEIDITARNNRAGNKTFRQELTSIKATISPSNNTINVSPASTVILNYNNNKKVTSMQSSKDDMCAMNQVTRRQKTSKCLPLKRRHTVSGIQDFDKFKWLLSNENLRSAKEPRLSAWEQLHPVESIPPEQRSLKSWMERERLRTSSPDLSHLRRTSIGDSLSIVHIDINKTDTPPMPPLESLV